MAAEGSSEARPHQAPGKQPGLAQARRAASRPAGGAAGGGGTPSGGAAGLTSPLLFAYSRPCSGFQSLAHSPARAPCALQKEKAGTRAAAAARAEAST